MRLWFQADIQRGPAVPFRTGQFSHFSWSKSSRSVKGWVSPLEKVTECSQRPNTVADDLSGRQHGHRQDRAGNTPHPEPEDERDDDEDGIEGEPSGQKHRR